MPGYPVSSVKFFALKTGRGRRKQIRPTDNMLQGIERVTQHMHDHVYDTGGVEIVKSSGVRRFGRLLVYWQLSSCLIAVLVQYYKPESSLTSSQKCHRVTCTYILSLV